jgi:hypothetical protein
MEIAMAHEDREKLFEKALTRQLRSSAPAVHGGDLQGNTSAESAGCPETEILAAYHERSLSPAELTSWKSHIVGCARCQEILKQLEMTEEIPLGAAQETELLVSQERQLVAAAVASAAAPSTPAMRSKVQPLPARRKMIWQWVAPAGAIAAMLLVWVSLRETKTAPPLRPLPAEMADQKSLPKAPGATAPSARLREHAVDNETDQLEGRLKTKEKERAGKNETPPLTAYSRVLRKDGAIDEETKPLAGLEKKQLQKVPPPPSPPLAVNDLAVNGRDFQQLTQLSPGTSAKEDARSNDNLRGQAAGVVGGAPSRARVAGKPPEKPSDDLRSGAPQNSQLQANNANAPIQSTSQSVEVQVQGAAAPVSTAAAPAPAAPQSADASKQADLSQITTAQEPSTSAFGDLQSLKLAKAKAENAHFAVVAGGNVIWRVGLAGFIAQSRDAGHTFTQQESGVKTELVAAAAPSESVCWTVGRSGTILRTIDGGAHWTKLVSPIKQNLGGVHAEDADHATIWDVPHRTSFATTDGGTTWTPVPNEQ